MFYGFNGEFASLHPALKLKKRKVNRKRCNESSGLG